MFVIKEKPEDFIVSEIADIYPEGKGEYSLYLLKKVNISTWDAIGKIAKYLRIPMDSIGFGGMKDKKSVAYQFITIKNGPKKDFNFSQYQLTYLGTTQRPMSKDLLLGNKFEIIVKNFSVEDERFEKEIELIKKYGVANYFDEQRFESVKSSKEFAVKELIKGNYEKALYLMLAEASAVDIQKTRKLRECLKKYWRQFEKCQNYAKVKWEKDLLEFLSKHSPSKRTFKRALGMVDKEYLFFLGNVYQSFLWNEILKAFLDALEIPLFSVLYILGELKFYKVIPEDLWEDVKDVKLPLPSPKLKLGKLQLGEKKVIDIERLYNEICEKEGISGLTKLRSFVKGLIFKTYPRPIIVFPKDLEWEKIDKSTIKLKFFLEKGSYATLLIKRLYYGYHQNL